MVEIEASEEGISEKIKRANAIILAWKYRCASFGYSPQQEMRLHALSSVYQRYTPNQRHEIAVSVGINSSACKYVANTQRRYPAVPAVHERTGGVSLQLG